MCSQGRPTPTRTGIPPSSQWVLMFLPYGYFGFVLFSQTVSPWYNRHGWLGVKKLTIYLSIYLSQWVAVDSGYSKTFSVVWRTSFYPDVYGFLLIYLWPTKGLIVKDLSKLCSIAHKIDSHQNWVTVVLRSEIVQTLHDDNLNWNDLSPLSSAQGA